jgi:hypothetical protein
MSPIKIQEFVLSFTRVAAEYCALSLVALSDALTVTPTAGAIVTCPTPF